MNAAEEIKRIVRVGTAGWAYDDWEGVVYPRRKGSRFDPIAYLARWFDCVEVNSTFYRMPEARVCRSWAERAGDAGRFMFTAKLHRAFTHERPGDLAADAASFLRGIEPLREAGRLGCVLMQFPWSFRNDGGNRGRLDSLISALPGLSLVVEVRHASWNTGSFYEYLAGRGVGFCNIDQPVFRDSMSPSARSTSPVGYVRIHGRNYRDWFREGAGRDARYDYLYSREELAEWAALIRALPGGLSGVYVIANNHYKGKAACNALELKSLLEDGPVAVPPPLLAAYPRLRACAIPDGQGELHFSGGG